MFTQIKHRTPGVLLYLCIACPSFLVSWRAYRCPKDHWRSCHAILLGIFIGLFHTLKSLYLSDWVIPP